MRRSAGQEDQVDLTKLLIFIVVTTLATGVLVITIGNLTFAGTKDYKAEFVDATGVVKGDDIRIAGVKVGTVKDVEIVDRTRALVTFTVQDDTALTEATHAAIRYRNLVGQRYLSLTQEVGDAGPLPEGGTIPVEQTSPALDLTVLFNGFKPLFQALSPDDINKLSYEIVQVFQGEGGTLESLLGTPPRSPRPSPTGPGHRRPDRQPQRGARPRRRPRRPARRPDHDLPGPSSAA